MPREHPLYGSTDSDFNVHGGITFNGACQGDICHVAEPGMPEDVWWFGFDTGHFMDISPSLLGLSQRNHLPLYSEMMGETYKDIPYVRAECEHLAKQLRTIEETK